MRRWQALDEQGAAQPLAVPSDANIRDRPRLRECRHDAHDQRPANCNLIALQPEGGAANAEKDFGFQLKDAAHGRNRSCKNSGEVHLTSDQVGGLLRFLPLSWPSVCVLGRRNRHQYQAKRQSSCT